MKSATLTPPLLCLLLLGGYLTLSAAVLLPFSAAHALSFDTEAMCTSVSEEDGSIDTFK